MIRSAFGLSVIVITLSGSVASAQNPAIGQLPLPGDLYGYSTLVPTIDPFPSRSTGYAPSMFGPNGGKRLYYPSVTRLSAPIPVAQGAVVANEPTVILGSVESAMPARGFRRFRR
ncbi:MAG: hypothetical protein C0467_19430 [Planctomycetaceae bacterium]|nr:hypothetical protein [Planctomycetaceae bacterium]